MNETKETSETIYGEKILTAPQAANYVGYKSTRRFRDWVRLHKVPYETRGRRRFFLQSILDKWLVKIAEKSARKMYQ